jgi:hypothetical protein
MSQSTIHPITIKLDPPFEYSLNSLVNRIVEKDNKFFDYEKTNSITQAYLDTVVLPTLVFLQKNDIKVNVIVGGKLLEYIEKNRRVKTRIATMCKQGSLQFVVDAYYGESLVCLFNTTLWVESIQESIDQLKAVFGEVPQCIFLPQIYRMLELEKVTDITGIHTFLTQKKGQKPDYFTMYLSDFRRFNGNEVSWIAEEKDVECTFYNVSDNLFYELNRVLFEVDIPRAGRAINMLMGLNYAQFSLKQQNSKRFLTKNSVRIEEKYSLQLYSHLQRGVIRLWEHGTMVLTSNQPVDDDLNNNLFLALAKLQSTFFLKYLEKQHYIGHRVHNFSSPYEAFVNMQSAIKEIEILVRNKV